MAIQNFLAGGYYGKLGDTVGQRWKDKRIVRAYAIPANPQTALQQENRGIFAIAVGLSQLGNTANWKSPAFNTSRNTQWAYRMSAATSYIKEGRTDLNLVPLYPKSFVVPHVIDGVQLVEAREGSTYVFRISGNVPGVGKGYTLMLVAAPCEEQMDVIFMMGRSSDNDPFQVTVENSPSPMPAAEEVYCRICSNDDSSADTITASQRLILA